MRMYDIIKDKKECKALSDEQIAFWVRGVVEGNIPDYQSSALLMAICLNGMDKRETASLTNAMARSGDMLDLSAFGKHVVDKHSTGGVGDKTTLVIAPIAAACGATVAKMSGRGLGHTGGTIDKLESIPGLQTSLAPEEFTKIVKQHGLCVVGQTGQLAPADKTLYALRDTTATVESIPLIAASIMSKKLAAGSKSIVLDVKCGSGAFMKTYEDAYALASAMVDIGHRHGRRMSALITDMDTPLGQNIGNALEVQEAVQVLKGRGPKDLQEVCLALASQMVSLAMQIPPQEAQEQAKEALDSGRAYQKLRDMVAAQGGDVRALDDFSYFGKAPVCHTVVSEQSGYIVHMDSEACGKASMLLGAGRQTKNDTIDPNAGIALLYKTGQYVRQGEAIATLFTSNAQNVPESERVLLGGIRFGEEEPVSKPLILGAIYPDEKGEE